MSDTIQVPAPVPGDLVATLEYAKSRLARFPEFKPGALMIERIEAALALSRLTDDEIRAAERKRLARVAMKKAAAAEHGHVTGPGQWLTGTQWRDVADWLRSQGGGDE
tara:strand:- start:34133 stop:34456 length:324 start_codon:yes stop_codon:yes gene_type:complete